MPPSLQSAPTLSSYGIKQVPFSPDHIHATDGQSMIIVSGPSGSGKSTFAREIAKLRGLDVHVFGTADYNDSVKFKRTLSALSASRGSGILMQLGCVSGIGVIFDELETKASIPRASIKLAIKFAAFADTSKRAVIYVVRRVADVSGLKKLSNKYGVTIEMPPPSQVQLALLARSVVDAVAIAGTSTGIGTNNDTGIGTDTSTSKTDTMYTLPWQTILPKNVSTMSSAIAALFRLATSDKYIVCGEGERDVVITSADMSVPELSSSVISLVSDNDMSAAIRFASVSPCAIANCHAASVSRLLRNPKERIIYARSYTAAAEHNAAAFGPAQNTTNASYNRWLGALAAPLLRTESVKRGGIKFKLVAFTLPSNIIAR